MAVESMASCWFEFCFLVPAFESACWLYVQKFHRDVCPRWSLSCLEAGAVMIYSIFVVSIRFVRDLLS